MDINVIEELTSAIGAMEKEVLRDTLAYLLKVYVLDQGLSYEGKVNTSSNRHHTGESPLSFVELIRELKSRYSMEELNVFSIEGGNVFVSIEGNTYQLTKNGNTGNTIKRPEVTNNDKSREKKISDNDLSASGRFEKLELE